MCAGVRSLLLMSTTFEGSLLYRIVDEKLYNIMNRNRDHEESADGGKESADRGEEPDAEIVELCNEATDAYKTATATPGFLGRRIVSTDADNEDASDGSGGSGSGGGGGDGDDEPAAAHTRYTELLFHAARMAACAGQHSEASASYIAALRSDPEDEWGMKGEIVYHALELAATLHRDHKAADAIKLAGKAGEDEGAFLARLQLADREKAEQREHERSKQQPPPQQQQQHARDAASAAANKEGAVCLVANLGPAISSCSLKDPDFITCLASEGW